MNRRVLPAILLLVGSAALFLLQRNRATTAVTPRPLLYLLADTQREAERIPLAVTRVSDADEIKEGQRVALGYGLLSPRPLNEDEKAIRDYLNYVGALTAAHVQRRDIPYHFYLQDHIVNAYALPGGHVVVGRGLLELLESEDELAAILGHEIAHVDNRHSIEKLQYELASRKLGLGGLYQLGSPAVQIFEAGYTKEQEFEADRVGLDLAVAKGYSPVGGVNVMKRFEKLEAEYSGKEATPLEGLTSVPFSALTEYFRSHPPASERRTALQAQIVARHWGDSTALRPFLIQNIFLTDAGERLARTGDFANSVAQFQKAVNIAPNYTRAWRGLAEARWRAGDAEGTLSAVAIAIHQLPTVQDWILAARALAALDSKDAVRRLATLGNESTVVGPDKVDSVARIEIAGLKLAKEQGEINELLAVLPTGQSPSIEARDRTEIAWWLYSAGRLQDAASQLQTARQLMPQALDSNLLLVWVLSDLGRQADAMEALEKSRVSSMPSWQQRAESDAARAVVEWRTENRDAAKAGFQEAARNDPSWMVEGWVKNNFSASVTGVVRQLQAIELARRAKELQERQGNTARYKTE